MSGRPGSGGAAPTDTSGLHRPTKVLHVCPSFYPATFWGGPIFSTKAICDAVHRSNGFEVEVLTTDAAGPSPRDRVGGLPAAGLETLAYPVRYCRRVALNSVSFDLLARLVPAIRSADLVHLTSTYSFPTLPTLLVARLLGKPVVWSPRGAIQAAVEWAQARRQGSKRAFERLARWFAPVPTVLLVTAEAEAQATAGRMPEMPVEIMPNSVELPPDAVLAGRSWRPAGRLRLLFLSRVHEKKGLDLLLDAMGAMGPEVELDIYGTGAESYLRRLAARVAELDLDARVRFHGHVDGATKARAFREADLLVLPTHSENFGIVVAEALAHGVPVVTTVHTPWTELDAKGCGRCVPLDAGAVTQAITELAAGDLAAMGARGRAWMRQDFSAERVHGRLLALYARLAPPQSGTRSA